MSDEKHEKIRSAIKVLGSDPARLEDLLTSSPADRRAKLDGLGIKGISRDDVVDFLHEDEVSGFALRRPGGGGPRPSTVEWVGAAATLAAGALA